MLEYHVDNIKKNERKEFKEMVKAIAPAIVKFNKDKAYVAFNEPFEVTEQDLINKSRTKKMFQLFLNNFRQEQFFNQ